ncbi:hypothetical protein VKT23_010021 [Stygiomarasmius scandens]|uniref:PARP catalytic domain-containing protein n=1 Tax=Marasmiellus scandens TaxID=2682957 RepID=A0ABR1JI33_9AGAR
MSAVATVASGLPLALSLLHTVANQYPGLTKSQPTTTTTTIPPAPPPPPPPPPPVSVPPSAPPQASLAAQTLGNQSVPQTSSTISGQVNASNGTLPLKTPSATSSTTLCESCHMKPKYFDGTKTHPYCSKTCARIGTKTLKFSSNNNSRGNSVSANPANCDFCHIRPKYSGHSFCSKTCARNAGTGSLSQSNPGTKALCHAPGCQMPAHINSDGTSAEYCSLSHKTFAETICLMCLQSPKLANSHFCSQNCEDEAEKKGPMILEVPASHVTFKSVADQFKASWRHPGSHCPVVKRVYKILAPKAQLDAYNAYRTAVEARGHFASAGRSAGNENRRWHGTRRECLLGDKGQTQFCSSQTCSLCCIVRTSFDLSLFGKKTGWGRFGRGIYTSSTSSKSNDYSSNDCKSPLKAMLLNKVVVGKGCKLTYDNVALTSPPPGYDSVLAEKGTSISLTFNLIGHANVLLDFAYTFSKF